MFRHKSDSWTAYFHACRKCDILMSIWKWVLRHKRRKWTREVCWMGVLCALCFGVVCSYQLAWYDSYILNIHKWSVARLLGGKCFDGDTAIGIEKRRSCICHTKDIVTSLMFPICHTIPRIVCTPIWNGLINVFLNHKSVYKNSHSRLWDIQWSSPGSHCEVPAPHLYRLIRLYMSAVYTFHTFYESKSGKRSRCSLPVCYILNIEMEPNLHFSSKHTPNINTTFL